MDASPLAWSATCPRRPWRIAFAISSPSPMAAAAPPRDQPGRPSVAGLVVRATAEDYTLAALKEGWADRDHQDRASSGRSPAGGRPVRARSTSDRPPHDVLGGRELRPDDPLPLPGLHPASALLGAVGGRRGRPGTGLLPQRDRLRARSLRDRGEALRRGGGRAAHRARRPAGRADRLSASAP